MGKHIALLQIKGPMPPFGEVADALWGTSVDVDSDGDSDTPESTNWRELTLILRANEQERIDIDPYEGDSNLLCVRGSSMELVESVVSFLVSVGAVQRMSLGGSNVSRMTNSEI